MLRCLITGASGFLGQALCDVLQGTHEVTGGSFRHGGPNRVVCDLRDAGAVEALIRAQRPDIVIHGAAYRDPDYCETNREDARRLNVEAVDHLCRFLPPAARLAFISSDYVFDGESPPYAETSPRRPVNYYGETKRLAEDIVLQRPGSLILRIPLLVGCGPTLDTSGFVGKVMKALMADTPSRYDDEGIRYPTSTRDVAEAIQFLLMRGADGVFHFSGERGRTQYAWTAEIARLMGKPEALVIPARAFARRLARRPQNSRLDVAKIRASGFDRFTDFAEVVREVLARHMNRP